MTPHNSQANLLAAWTWTGPGSFASESTPRPACPLNEYETSNALTLPMESRVLVGNKQ